MNSGISKGEVEDLIKKSLKNGTEAINFFKKRYAEMKVLKGTSLEKDSLTKSSKKTRAKGRIRMENDKTRRGLLDAIEGAKAYNRELQMKREEGLWKQIITPCGLTDVLCLLTKNELDIIRKKLELKGLSSLKKADLARELEQLIPVNFKKVLFTFDQERYNLIQKNNKKFQNNY